MNATVQVAVAPVSSVHRPEEYNDKRYDIAAMQAWAAATTTNDSDGIGPDVCQSTIAAMEKAGGRHT